MNKAIAEKFNIPDGACHYGCVDQWSETKHTVMGNVIYMRCVDRRDPRIFDDNGRIFEGFISFPGVEEHSRKRILEMVENYAV